MWISSLDCLRGLCFAPIRTSGSVFVSANRMLCLFRKTIHALLFAKLNTSTQTKHGNNFASSTNLFSNVCFLLLSLLALKSADGLIHTLVLANIFTIIQIRSKQVSISLEFTSSGREQFLGGNLSNRQRTQSDLLPAMRSEV